VVWIPPATEATARVYERLCDEIEITGNLVPDAQLAALAIEHGVEIASADTDFMRFPGLRWVNPLSG
jgi:predicted nucleic acid-binding protein